MRIEQNFIADIKDIVQGARNQTYAAINFYMLEAYWKIGERIVMEEQKGEKRAEYGTFLIKELSKKLSNELGKGLPGLKKAAQCAAFFKELKIKIMSKETH